MPLLMSQSRLGLVVFVAAMTIFGISARCEEIAIFANPGPFGSVEAAAAAEAQVDWWDADVSDDDACTECFAAVELRTYLARCLQVQEASIALQAVAEGGGLPEKGVVFVLGSRESNPIIAAMPAPEGESAEALEKAESFHIRISTEGTRTTCVIEGSDRVGTLYGVYSYLERLKMRFYGLGEQGTVYPERVPELPGELDYAGTPDFYTRGFWAWEDRGNEDFFLWMAHNKMNFWTAYEKELHFCKKLGLKLTVGGHDPQKLFLDPVAGYPYNHPRFDGDEDKPADPYAPPPENEYKGDADGNGTLTYFEAHPEWYGLHKGERRGDIGTEFGTCNFCTSNGDAVKELSRNFVQGLIDGDDYRHADIVNFWMLDCGKWCECARCTAMGNLSYRLVMLMYDVRKAMQEAMDAGLLTRNVELVSLAYHETLPAPDHPAPEDFDYRNVYFTYFPIERTYTHALGDPASTEVNLQLQDWYRGWLSGENRNYKGDLCIGEYYNVSSLKSLPAVYTAIMAVDIPWYYRTGARHFQYMHTPTKLWGTWTLNQYLMGRLIWDASADADAIVDEYFERHYATASDEARMFYEHLEKATANIKAFKHYTLAYSLRNALNQKAKDLFPKDTLQYDAHDPLLNKGISVVEMLDEMHLARRALDAALLGATDDTVKARLLEDEARFAYGEAMYRFLYHLVRITMFHNRGDETLAKHEWESVYRYAVELEGIVDLVQVSSSHANAKNGLDASQVTGAYGFYKKTYGGGE